MTLHDTIKRILNAKVYEAAHETPLEPARNLSTRLGNTVLIKREDLQPVFSFKIRGAYNRMANLSSAERERGVICASAGNHAQGTAYSARKLKIRATIVMPKTTPEIKVEAVRSHGGSYVKVVLHGDAFDEAAAHSRKLMEEHGLTYIHPYDDPLTIAGQGTVAREILHQCTQPVDAVFIPVGGGGLAAGMAAYIKYLQPEIRVIGVEFEESACLAAALAAGKRVKLEQVGIFADGVAVAQVGEHPWEICRTHVDEVITVSSDEICGAVKDMFDDTRSVAEPAGALALAGVKKYVAREHCSGQRLIAVASGANMNFDRLRYVAEQAEVGEEREALLAVTIPERPGSFLRFCSLLGKRSITEFNYRFDDQDEANIFVGIQISGRPEREQMLGELQHAGFPVLDLTDNQIAKSHIRHMVGGRSHHAADEVLYGFVFPERPGALLNFLKRIGKRWNISLFHYRNHGAAYGRVLCGFQVPLPDRDDFRARLDKLGYSYQDETANPVYRIFL
ncbi:threonine ammonia-lyase, biosynthetic [Spirochaeta africana]|uniref:L-threonine dehydratase n=1 Tax=Spirochaeta africana (strain ATCC 700263 / DSM 8902 / Z-7692) TaxID=889378 RepID=U3GKT8_SPIAZ|nr:threonine ammonia-lyase, biosynthetic [Spirochaeta africana]AFG36812.1 threonine ammonia-lyase, biosynthetic, long form [Spirochaeta africana DSM 8902]